ncbi:LysM peptidoglycan-binding domain-containing M23 family metallopeptidase [Pseudoponticoccus marisrubri]|uniref:Peptidase M23 n=1 Tax=Pseudoponticoccus marisrubri TaxID=1685382 RepID=A0A0W7WLH6_9RHOB|nr:LysM peptidoglycan-binding domain-containing M23 family metallopeptidase [Pseudoponticoccus marisrubri]KUF11383.1 peptidase M23 [Pseudoponticoccus marisrubri]
MTAAPRTATALALVLTLGACADGLDLDLRGKIGSRFDTSDAARQAVADRPDPDDRGIISYPNYQVAVARRGDTVTSLANRIGLSPGELARYNGVQVDDPLRRGEIIALPRRVAEPSPATGAPTTGPIRPAAEVDVATLAGNALDNAPDTSQRRSASQPQPQTGEEPVRHQVTRGETAFTIARLYGVTPRSLAQWNGLDSDYTLREGQFLLIPVVQDSGESATEAVTDPGDGSPTPPPPSASRPLPQETPPAANTPAPSAQDQATAPEPDPEEPVADIGQEAAEPARDAAMIKPVEGAIIRDYAKGRNEGIDISAPAGTPVKAAASGSVASVSTTAEGVKFLLIRHPGDLITVYTHLDNITVEKGDAVSRGQTLGKVRPGDPSFLHFEVRQGFESTDPMAYLR